MFLADSGDGFLLQGVEKAATSSIFGNKEFRLGNLKVFFPLVTFTRLRTFGTVRLVTIEPGRSSLEKDLLARYSSLTENSFRESLFRLESATGVAECRVTGIPGEPFSFTVTCRFRRSRGRPSSFTKVVSSAVKSATLMVFFVLRRETTSRLMRNSI